MPGGRQATILLRSAHFMLVATADKKPMGVETFGIRHTTPCVATNGSHPRLKPWNQGLKQVLALLRNSPHRAVKHTDKKDALVGVWPPKLLELCLAVPPCRNAEKDLIQET